MDLDDMTLVSIDDHMIEPPDLFERQMPVRYRDRAPKLVSNPDGPDTWIFQGEATGTVGLSAVVSLPKEQWGFDPTHITQMRPGCYDVSERVNDMDVNGLLAGMNFPTFPGFAGTHVAKAPDRDLAAATISAWNGWAIDEVAGDNPGRFIPMGIVPHYDMDATVGGIHRIATKGCKAVSVPEAPYGLGLPSFASGHWDPMFAALLDTGMIPCMHIGGAFGLIQRPTDVPPLPDDLIIMAPQVMAVTTTDIILGGLIQRFPDLKFALSEGGIGWVSFYLDRLDRHVANHAWTHLDKLPRGKTPTETWREHFLACFITDPTALQVRERVGVESLAWECDYPHSDCTWPNSPELLKMELDAAGCTDDEIDMITWKNVARFFDYDPFAHIPREAASVGALRARAAEAGVDTAVTTKAEYSRRYHEALAGAG